MLEIIRRLLAFRIAIAELIAVAVLAGAPYLLVGAVWTAVHIDRFPDLAPIDRIVSFFGSVVFWPVLLTADLCLG